MTTWFVTRHEGALDWAREEGILASDTDVQMTDTIVPARDVRQGDVVIGTLPVHLVAEIGEHGGRYFHLAMTVPTEHRGKEFSAEQMRAFGSQLRNFIVFGTDAQVRPPVNEPAKTLHVCLVSAQYMANLLPVLKRRPGRVELVCTPEMSEGGSGLASIASALEHFGYTERQVGVHRLTPEASTDLAAARQEARALRVRLLKNYPGWTLVLNSTGGTKALSTAFFMEFQGVETIYTDTANGGFIRQLSDASQPAEPLGQLIPGIADFLYCQGYRQVEQSTSEWEIRAKTRKLVSNHLSQLAQNESNFISNLNEWRMRVEREAFDGQKPRAFPEVEREKRLARAMNMCVRQFGGKFARSAQFLAEQKMLCERDDGAYSFANANAMDFLGGGWLEEWVWLEAKACNPHALAANVVVQAMDDKRSTPNPKEHDNELDLVLLHNNRLLIAECKTIRWSGQGAKQEIFNKLDALTTHARGLFGQSILVSAYPLDEKALRRAKAYGIRSITLAQPGQFRAQLQAWMNLPA